MGAVGNLNDFVKFQMAQGLGSGTGGGAAGSAAEIAMGFGMAQQLMNQPGGILGQQSTPPVAGGTPGTTQQSGSGLPEILTPADAAGVLGVTEADVMAALSDGSLKGKKIGAAYRITRQALEDFLKH
jgi:excisionase family DNA binding protein